MSKAPAGPDKKLPGSGKPQLGLVSGRPPQRPSYLTSSVLNAEGEDRGDSGKISVRTDAPAQALGNLPVTPSQRLLLWRALAQGGARGGLG